MSNNKTKKNADGMNNPLGDPARKNQENLDSLNTFSIPEMKTPQIGHSEMPNFKLPVDQNLSDEFYKRLIRWINDFDKALDQEHEVGVRLVNLGQTIIFHLKNIGFLNPSLISFSGVTENGEPVALIQHVSQMSILLLKMERNDPTKPKTPIGFTTLHDDDQSKF